MQSSISNLVLCLVLVSGMPGSTMVSRAETPQSCIPYAVDFKSAQAGRSKIGFDQLAGNAPWKRYLSQTTVEHNEATRTCGNQISHASWLNRTMSVYQRDEARETRGRHYCASDWDAPTQLTYGGSVNYADPSSACAATRNEDGSWTDPACEGLALAFLAKAKGCVPETTSISRTGWVRECAQQVVDGDCSWDINARIEVTLGEEYDNGMLLEDILKLMPPYSSEWGPGPVAASYTLSGRQNCGFAKKMKYRFRFQGAKDASYRIDWEEITQQPNGEVSVQHLDEVVAGNGGETLSREHECEVPAWAGGEEDGMAIRWISDVVVRLEPTGGDDGLPGAGGANWSSGGNGCRSCRGSSNNQRGFPGIDIGFSLGQVGLGQSAGSLRLIGADPSLPFGSPALLRNNAELGDVEVINANGMIRQVKTALVLADIWVASPTQYEIRFYFASAVLPTKTDHLYVPTGNPFVTWSVESHLTGAQHAGSLLLSENRAGSVRTWTYRYDPDGKLWRLIYPGGLRIDEQTSAFENGKWVERSIVKSPGAEVYRQTRVYSVGDYQGFPSRRLLESTEGNGSEVQTTKYTYQETGAWNGFSVPVSLIEYPDGSWERFHYDARGRLWQNMKPWGDATPVSAPTQCRVFEYLYGSGAATGSGDLETTEPETARRVDEFVLGQRVATRYTLFPPGEKREVQCATPGAAWDDPNNLTTTTRYFTTGANRGRTQSVRNADGTMAFYDYADDLAAGYRTVVSKVGRPSASQQDIIDGVVTTTVTARTGRPVARTVRDVASGITLESEVFGNPDEWDRPRQLTHLDGSQDQLQYSCCGLESTVDRFGVTTTFQYDGLRRLTGSSRLGVTLANTLDPLGRILVTSRLVAGAPAQVVYAAVYDSAGKVVSEANALGGITRYAEGRDSVGRRVRTVSLPMGGGCVETYCRDGRMLQVTGSAAFPARYEYGLERNTTSPGLGLLFSKRICLDAAGLDTSEWTTTYSDALDRPVMVLFADRTPGTLADNPKEQWFYGTTGQLLRRIDADGVVNLYDYDGKGELVVTATDLNGNNVIDYAGPDRIESTWTDAARVNGVDVRRVRRFIWGTPDSAVSNLVSSVEVSADGLTSWERSFDGPNTMTTRTVRTLPINGSFTVTVTRPDNSTITKQFTQRRLVSVIHRSAAGQTLGETRYEYDAYGRVARATDARNGTVAVTYNANDQQVSVTMPAAGNGEAAQTTSLHYDTWGRADSLTRPDGTVVSYTYTDADLVSSCAGGGTFPVRYEYDAQGRMTAMTTWQNASLGTGAAVTSWRYDPQRGWPVRKIHAEESDGSDDLDYSPAGRVRHRYAERGAVTTYSYNNAGDLQGVAYSDSTPALSFNYDRRGRRSTVTQGGVSSVNFSYSNLDQIRSERWVGGPLDGVNLAANLDALGRRTILVANFAAPYQVNYSYDDASRLQKVTSGNFSAAYGYVPLSSLVGSVAIKQGAETRLTTTRQYDFLNRLVAMGSSSSTTDVPPLSYALDYDAGNREQKIALGDGSAWRLEYDRLDQLVSARRSWGSGEWVPGQQYLYQFDHIGNRVETRSGGDAEGNRLRRATYSSNLRNQIVSRAVPSGFDVMGLSGANSAVTVNNQPVDYRLGEFFQKTLEVANSAAAVWPTVGVSAVTDGVVSSAPSGGLFVPASPESFVHDADGNLAQDGRWNLTWDAENRLVRMVTRTSAGPSLRLDFTYDWAGRRNSKKVWNNTAGTGTPVVDELFVYDGWNLLAELNATNRAVIRSYVWGLDLSGGMQGAGGAGGLLLVNVGGATTHAPAYDANGNVAALIDASTGNATAVYEQGPFGEPIRITGLMGRTNPFRYSTKFTDDESGLVYYGYRAPHPEVGQWLKRTEPGERSGMFASALNCKQQKTSGWVDGAGWRAESGRRPGSMWWLAGLICGVWLACWELWGSRGSREPCALRRQCVWRRIFSRVFLQWICLGLLGTQPAWAYYNPSTGRWLNRDPLNEQGGVGLQVFVANHPLGSVDTDGREMRNAPPISVSLPGGAVYPSWDYVAPWDVPKLRLGQLQIPFETKLGLMGNACSVMVGGTLLLTPEPTTLTKLVGGYMVVSGLDGLQSTATGQPGAREQMLRNMGVPKGYALAAVIVTDLSVCGPCCPGGGIPRGFKDAAQFEKAMNELRQALKSAGISDATVGVRGSSITGISSKTGKAFGPSSDIDFFVESGQLTDGLRTSRNIPGFVHPSKIMRNCSPLQEWSEAWTQMLGHKVTLGGFQPGTAPPNAIIIK